MKNLINNFISLPSRAVAALIRAYQILLSPDHSWLKGRYPYGFCKHYPTCSEYSKQSFLKFGLIKGLHLSVKRVLRCNPWSEPSVDLVAP